MTLIINPTENNKMNFTIIEGKQELEKKYVNKNIISPDTFNEIYKQVSPKFYGYMDWIIQQYLQKKEIKEILPILDQFIKYKYKIKEKDINKYENLEELQKEIEIAKQTKSKKETKLAGAEKVYEDENVLVIIPNTFEASCYYGANTKWCTTSVNNPSHFKSYKGQGKLFYIIDKKENKKFAIFSYYLFDFINLPENEYTVGFDENDKDIKPDFIIKKYNLNPKLFENKIINSKELAKTKEGIETLLIFLDVKNYIINEDLTVDSSNAYINGKNIKYFPFKWNKIGNIFDCENNYITSFENFPNIVNGRFSFLDNNITGNLVYYKEGEKFEENYKNGKKDGKYYSWHDNGKLNREWNYKDGNYDGKQYWWYKNEKLYKEENYKNGKRDGKEYWWWPNGNKESETNYENGELNGKQYEWYNNGKLYKEENYKNGKKDGKQYRWYSNEKLSCEENYKDGILDGKQYLWYDNGKLYKEENYKNGKRDGKEYWWYNDGGLFHEYNYKNGKLITNEIKSITKFKILKESIIDQPQIEKNPYVWQDNKLNPQIKDKILEILKDKNIDYKEVYIIGSITGTQYTEESDIDITVFSNVPIEELKKYRKIFKIINSRTYFGVFPLNYFFRNDKIENVIKISDAIYDLIKDKWIKKSETTDKDYLESVLENPLKLADKIARKLDIELDEISEDVIEIMDRYRNKDYNVDKKLENLQLEIENYVGELDEVHRKRTEIFTKALEDSDFKSIKKLGSANLLPWNIIYKYLIKNLYYKINSIFKDVLKTEEIKEKEVKELFDKFVRFWM